MKDTTALVLSLALVLAALVALAFCRVADSTVLTELGTVATGLTGALAGVSRGNAQQEKLQATEGDKK